MDRNYLDQRIRKISDFPKKGVLFYDVTTLFEDAEAFRKMIDEMCQPYEGQQIHKIIGIDARGFLLASAIAYKLGAGISIVRKKGKLPHKTRFASYEKEYGPDTVEMHEDTIKPGEKVIIVDDLLATGGTMLTTVDLVEQMKGDIIGIHVIINLTFLSGEKLLREGGNHIHCLIDYDNEEVR